MGEQTEKPHIALIVFCFVMCIGSVGTEFYTINLFRRAREIESWPTTKGIIQGSEVDASPSGYTARITYSYKVEDKTFLSSEVRVKGTTSKYESDAKAFVKRFPLHAEVIVYYQKSDPTIAYLEAGVHFVDYVILVTPIVYGLIMGAGFVGLIHMRLKPPQAP